jgi:hypothetical protein
MQDNEQRILSLMADGAYRSHDAIQIMVKMDLPTVGKAIHGLIDAGLLERDMARGDEAYVITMTGLIDLQEPNGGTPLYRE